MPSDVALALAARPYSNESSLSVRQHDGDLIVGSRHESSYPVVLTSDVRAGLAQTLAGIRRVQRCESAFLVVDKAIAGQLRPRIEQALADCDVVIAGVEAIGGAEADKSLRTVERLWRALHRRRVARRTLLVGVGGGVTCDVSGFTASTFMRGIPYVLVPTTLMAQVDAAIGGKVGVDYAARRNLIGTFFHPAGVVVDVTLLQRLPDRIWAAGMAEVVKVATIGSPELFEMADPAIRHDLRRHPAVLREVVELAISEKLRHLGPDPYEVGNLRRLLNFGHCVGHAVEAEVGFRWLHGECVAVGMAVASRAGSLAGVTSDYTVTQIHAVLDRLGLPTRVPRRKVKAVWRHLERIRAVRGGALNLVVPSEIGHAEVLNDWPAHVPWGDVA